MMKEQQFRLIQHTFVSAKQNSRLYQDKFSQIDDSFLQDEQSFRKLPFTNKDDLRAIYPLGLQAVPEEKIVRIHSSSGTTGTPIIIPYTKQDVDDWALLFRRCYELAGITSRDRIQITPGYGLWTAGIGFQLGAELLGAMTIPTGPGNKMCIRDSPYSSPCYQSIMTILSSFAISRAFSTLGCAALSIRRAPPLFTDSTMELPSVASIVTR